MSNLNVINFSDGIRSEEIQENFEILENQINRERINVGGSGIASGLNIVPIVDNKTFAIKISEASIITLTGEEIHIDEQIIDIPKPVLTEQCEYLSIDKENKVTLNEIPYSLDRTKPVQYCESFLPENSGIRINYVNSSFEDDGIRVKDVSNTTLTLTGVIKRNIVVKYYSTAKRLDTVYIDKNNKVQVKISSITSTTPSAILPNEYKYLIAYIEVDDLYKESKLDIPHANITIKKDLRNLRNIYTDKNGQLFLKGVSFDDLQLIATKQPIDPKENQLWLNENNNTLYIYKKVNNYSYVKSLEVTTIFGDGDKKDYTTDLTYRIKTNELSVYVNNEKLNENEYAELFDGLPVNEQNVEAGLHSNIFRIYKDLKLNDIIKYKISYKQAEMIWVPVNKESYVNEKEIKIYGINEEWDGGNYWKTEKAVKLGTDENGYPLKYRVFLFDYIQDRRMFFVPGRNEVEVVINQLPLHHDQFVELTLGNLYEYIQNVDEILFDNYNWNNYEMERLYDNEDNMGIGIALVEPLDAIYKETVTEYPKTPIIDWESYMNENGKINEDELYVEIKVNRAVSSDCSKRLLQRAATFVNEESIIIEDSSKLSIDIKTGFYRYGENQLEVYLNGIRLRNKVDYEEGTDIGDPDIDKLNYVDYINEYYTSLYFRNEGTISRRFTLKTNINTNDVVTYRITSTYYSYDHINSLLDEIDLNFEQCTSKVNLLYKQSLELNENTIFEIKNMKNEISDLIGNTANPENKYLTRSSIIGEDQIDYDILKKIPQTLDFINCRLTYNGTSTIDITNSPYDIRNKDFVIIVRRDNTNVGDNDRLLIRNADYEIKDSIINDAYFKTYLVLKESFLPNINSGDYLIINGIRFEREDR